MSKKKDDLKKLKQPDAFQKEMFFLGDWIVKHQKALITAAIPVVVIVLLIVGWAELQSYQKSGRINELGKIDQVHDEENKKAGEVIKKIQEESEVLTKKLTEASSKLPEGTETSPEIDKLKADIEATEKKMSEVEPDHSKSFEMYKKYSNDQSSKPEGWRAGLMAAKILIDTKKFTEAEEILAPVMKESVSLRFYQTHIRLMYISLLEENGKYDEALKQVSLLLSIADDDKDIEAKALLAQGRLLLLKDNKKEAFQSFDTLITKHESSAEARKAMAIKSL